MAYDDDDPFADEDAPVAEPAPIGQASAYDEAEAGDEHNPFEEGVPVAAATTGLDGKQTDAYSTVPDQDGGAYGDDADAEKGLNLPQNLYSSNADNAKAAVGVAQNGLDRREQLLIAKEREIREKEMLIRMREEKLMGTYVAADNWPCKCYPITYHSIREDVDPKYQPHMKKMYAIALLSMFCFVWNTIAILVAWFAECVDQAGLVFVWAGAYLFIGLWMMWVTWYKGMYNKLKSTQDAKKWAIKWWWIFFWFMAHTVWCGFCATGPTNWGMAGGLQMIDCFKGYQGGEGSMIAGVTVLIGVVVWSLNLLISIIMLKRSCTVYKTLDIHEQAKSEGKGILAAAEFAAKNADQFVGPAEDHPSSMSGGGDKADKKKKTDGGLKMTH